MKKNLMSVIILALVVVNVVLTSVLMISILPQTKQANELISKVCTAIDLDLEGASENAGVSVPLDQIVTYSVNEGENLVINLKTGEDGVEHLALMNITLGLNKKDEDYKTYGSSEQLADKEGMIKDKIYSVVSSHTVDEMRNEQDKIQDELLKQLRKMYDSNFIVSVSYTVTYQ